MQRPITAGAAIVIALLWSAGSTAARQVNPQLDDSIAQLRHAVGDWNVTTEFLQGDGTVARRVEGTYHFEWVVPGRVISGHSAIPELSQRSAILFDVSEGRGVVEMVAVGPGGQLWVMSGPLGDETRTTEPVPDGAGGQMRLRFTRYNVSADRFESRMERSTDNGATWKPGNHQVFVRAGR